MITSKQLLKNAEKYSSEPAFSFKNTNNEWQTDNWEDFSNYVFSPDNFSESNKQESASWWKQIETWRKKNSLGFVNNLDVIKPQYAVQKLYELTK